MRRSMGFLPAASVLSLALSATVLAAPAASGWSLQTTPNPAGAMNSFLPGDSCTSATACTAVGYSINTSDTVTSLAERWNGTAWSIQATPNPAGAVGSSLAAVACTSGTACTAVGDYFNSSNIESTVDERWNGTAWSVQPTPNPAGANSSELVSVACTATRSCIAVGSYMKTASSHPLSLAERWNGTAWSILTTLNPTGNRGTSLTSVACSSATACTAVGNWFNTSNTEVTLAERWNGTVWSIQTTRNPTTHLSELFGVACSTATACMAVGSYINTSFLELALVERWNGTTWSVVTTPTPTGSTGWLLQAIACATAKGCNAVGESFSSAEVPLTLAEKWNGTSWTIKPSPNPATATASDLLAVSCLPTACTATGNYSTSTPPSLNDKTLAEQT
jgi:hypothetical protein